MPYVGQALTWGIGWQGRGRGGVDMKDFLIALGIVAGILGGILLAMAPYILAVLGIILVIRWLI